MIQVFKEINFVDFKESKGDKEALMTAFMPVLRNIFNKQLSRLHVKNIIEKMDI